METVTEVVSDALQLIKVRTAESAITSTEAEDGKVSLNDMMDEWNIDGIDIGYERLDDVEDELFVTPGSIGAIKANLAIYISPEYGGEVTQDLRNRAKRSKRSLRASIPLNASQYPDSLPIGSGNEDNHFVSDGDAPGGLRDSRFYPSNAERKCN